MSFYCTKLKNNVWGFSTTFFLCYAAHPSCSSDAIALVATERRDETTKVFSKIKRWKTRKVSDKLTRIRGGRIRRNQHQNQPASQLNPLGAQTRVGWRWWCSAAPPRLWRTDSVESGFLSVRPASRRQCVSWVGENSLAAGLLLRWAARPQYLLLAEEEVHSDGSKKRRSRHNFRLFNCLF